ncbi:ABC transporter ATP-binding protein [Salinimonas marina]|uniref:ABC transporter ATP-binding protein n=1 Tax=Salinimonas marina TaxID=2785918 RepID=A0A7S9DWJ7_9ALTE|nr:ABC transporter ATP-binding protein [Salinimonas marina]QPG05147.1 ABC transporter ATP-binding protein [Salinimonas marina]
MKTNLRYGLKLFRQYKASFLLVLGLLIIETAVSLVLPKLIASDIAAMQTLASTTQLGLASVGLWALLIVFQGTLRYVSGVKLNTLGATLTADLNNRLYTHIQSLPMRFFHHTNKGDILALLTHDLGVVSFYITSVVTTLIPNLLIFVGCAVLMFAIEPWISLIIVSVIPFLFVISKLLGRKIHPLANAIANTQAQSLAVANENISTISLVKSFTREQVESKRYARTQADLKQLRIRQFGFQSLLSPLVQTLTAIAVIAILGISIFKLESEALALADMVALLLYGLIFIRPISAFAGLYGQTQHLRGAASRLSLVWEAETENYHSLQPGHTAVSLPTNEVRFENVSFSYQPDHPVLTNVNFTLKPGGAMLIVGDNGAGKSTMLNLLLQYYQPDEGRIMIGGQDSRVLGVHKVRQRIGYVPQDVVLQSGTVHNNIALGCEGATDVQVIDAANKAGLTTIIASLPLGLNTQVGEGGIRLSGGNANV